MTIQLFRNRAATGLVTLTVVLLGSIPTAAAACRSYPPQHASINDPYEFVAALIDSLGSARQAPLRMKSNDPSSLISEIKQARGDYECAAAQVEGFVASTNQFIQANAQSVHGVYGAIAELHNKFASEIVQILDQTVEGEVSPGRLADRLSDLAVGRDNLLFLLAQLSATSTYTMVELSEQGKPTGRLRLTESQRQSLLKRIEYSFGPTVRRGLKGGQKLGDAAAAAIYKFLSDREWRSAPDKRG